MRKKNASFFIYISEASIKRGLFSWQYYNPFYTFSVDLIFLFHQRDKLCPWNCSSFFVVFFFFSLYIRMVKWCVFSMFKSASNLCHFGRLALVIYIILVVWLTKHDNKCSWCQFHFYHTIKAKFIDAHAIIQFFFTSLHPINC